MNGSYQYRGKEQEGLKFFLIYKIDILIIASIVIKFLYFFLFQFGEFGILMLFFFLEDVVFFFKLGSDRNRYRVLVQYSIFFSRLRGFCDQEIFFLENWVVVFVVLVVVSYMSLGWGCEYR